MNFVEDQKGDVLADSHNILNRCKNYFSQLLNVRRVGVVRQMEIHTFVPLVLEHLPITKLKDINSQAAEQIQIEAGTLRSEIHKIIYSICNKKQFPKQWKGHIIVPIYKTGHNSD
jgi:hypothetical protein